MAIPNSKLAPNPNVAVITCLFVLLTVGNSVQLAAQEQPVTADGAELVKISDDFAFTEGPAVDANGNVYFTDQPNDRILKWDAEAGTIETWLSPAGRANGTWFDSAGNLLACADGNNELWSISPEKEITVLLTSFDSKLLNGPNDLWCDSNDRIYFTDPLYKRPYWDRDGESQMDGEHLYRFDRQTGDVLRVADGFVRPNGIIGTADGKQLYVADIGDSKTYRFDVEEDGSLSNRELFCEQGSDGMTIDELGNIYLTGRGVSVFDKSGEKIQQIDVPERWTANVTFGGVDRNILFITASTAVYRIDMQVSGVTPVEWSRVDVFPGR